MHHIKNKKYILPENYTQTASKPLISRLTEAITMKNARMPDQFIFQGVSAHDGQTDFERLSKRFIDFRLNGSSADPMSDPVNLVSKIKNQYKMVRYYFIAQLLKWPELVTELQKQLDYYKYTEADLQDIKKYIDSHKSSWDADYRKALALISKSGIPGSSFEDYFIKSMLDDLHKQTGNKATGWNKYNDTAEKTTSYSDDDDMLAIPTFGGFGGSTSTASLGKALGGTISGIRRVPSTGSKTVAFRFDFMIDQIVNVKDYANTDWAKSVRAKFMSLAAKWKVIFVGANFYVNDWDPHKNQFKEIFGDVTFKFDPAVSKSSYAALI